jgi:hypothetical protein
METLAGPRTIEQTSTAKAYTMVVDFKEMCRTATNAVHDPLRCSGKVFGVPIRRWHEWDKARTSK